LIAVSDDEAVSGEGAVPGEAVRPDPAPDVVAGERPAPGARPAALVILAVAAAIALGLDQLTKQLALSNLSDAAPARLLGGAVYLTVTRNSGAAFSIGGGYTAVFPVIAFVVVIFIGVLARRLRSTAWALALGLGLGGALGNLTDRLLRAPGPMHGHVVDFISVFDPAGRAFPIFNVADSALFCGVVLAFILELTGRGRDGGRVPDSDRA
jgi:signal peptidase II